MNFIAGILVCNMNQEVSLFLFLFTLSGYFLSHEQKPFKEKNDENNADKIAQKHPVLTYLLPTIIFLGCILGVCTINENVFIERTFSKGSSSLE
jgi:hypothetical protein